ncbi:MAG: molybdopterin molybdotransferase MoeA, partial [Clostridiales Family XIII bacterium]|nr:molybdopterin molybdotransferase MoeA [Clostridiales Family XIII bacterium]
MLQRIDLEKAIELICEGAGPLAPEETDVISANGRVLAEAIVSPADQPPFPRSPLDGYAFDAASCEGATKERPAVLKVVEKLCAGDWSERTVGRGEAVKLMTGAMIPRGCNCVIMQEETDGGTDAVRVYKRLKPDENYCFAGEDYKKGDLLLPAFARIDPAAMAVIASAGLSRVRVIRRPRVSVISTGDELTAPGTPRGNGKIYCSNNYYIEARLAEMGADIAMSCVARDDAAELRSRIESAAAESDLIVSTGGVSVGEKDLVIRVLEEMGADVVFHRIRIKPGSPAAFSRCRGVRLLSLSGNPFASAASLELLARPLLAAMTGDRTL